MAFSQANLTDIVWLCVAPVAFLMGWIACRWTKFAKRAEIEFASHSALKLLRDVFDRTDNISRELIEYRDLLAGLANRVKTSDQAESSSELLSRFMELNEHLQQRLEDSERALQEQTSQLAMYISQARIDSHSGLHNRRAFDEELDRQVAYWGRNHHPFSLIMIDIDHFKSINDRFGHQTGDMVIQSIGAVLKQTFRNSDFVARYGGEEFVAVLRGADLAMATCAAERCCEAIRERPIEHQGATVRLTASCGVATILENEDGPKLIKRADEALYQAKARGRDNVVVHDGSDFQIDRHCDSTLACSR